MSSRRENTPAFTAFEPNCYSLSAPSCARLSSLPSRRQLSAAAHRPGSMDGKGQFRPCWGAAGRGDSQASLLHSVWTYFNAPLPPQRRLPVSVAAAAAAAGSAGEGTDSPHRVQGRSTADLYTPTNANGGGTNTADDSNRNNSDSDDGDGAPRAAGHLPLRLLERAWESPVVRAAAARRAADLTAACVPGALLYDLSDLPEPPHDAGAGAHAGGQLDALQAAVRRVCDETGVCRRVLREEGEAGEEGWEPAQQLPPAPATVAQAAVAALTELLVAVRLATVAEGEGGRLRPTPLLRALDAATRRCPARAPHMLVVALALRDAGEDVGCVEEVLCAAAATISAPPPPPSSGQHGRRPAQAQAQARPTPAERWSEVCGAVTLSLWRLTHALMAELCHGLRVLRCAGPAAPLGPPLQRLAAANPFTPLPALIIPPPQGPPAAAAGITAEAWVRAALPPTAAAATATALPAPPLALLPPPPPAVPLLLVCRGAALLWCEWHAAAAAEEEEAEEGGRAEAGAERWEHAQQLVATLAERLNFEAPERVP